LIVVMDRKAGSPFSASKSITEKENEACTVTSVTKSVASTTLCTSIEISDALIDIESHRDIPQDTRWLTILQCSVVIETSTPLYLTSHEQLKVS
jgi:hypothetical protein